MSLAPAPAADVTSARDEVRELLREIREQLSAGIPTHQLGQEIADTLDGSAHVRTELRATCFAAFRAAAADHDRLLDLLAQAHRRYESERELWLLLEPMTRAQ